MRVWRLCKARFAASAFSGEGARLYAGRWNPAGVSMVYTSTSLALAAMEFFVHLDPSVAPDDLVVSCATLPNLNFKIERIDPEQLPSDWRSMDNPASRKVGAEWIASGRSAALQVSSVAVEGEWNVLLNPAHQDFRRIVIEEPKGWRFDSRMFRREI